MESERLNIEAVDRELVGVHDRSNRPATADPLIRVVPSDEPARGDRPGSPETTTANPGALPAASSDTIQIDPATVLDGSWLGQAVRQSLRAVESGGAVTIACDLPAANAEGTASAVAATRTRVVAALQASIEPGSARIGQIELEADPDAKPGETATRLTVVVRKTGEQPSSAQDRAEAVFPFRREVEAVQIAPGMRLQDGVLVRDFASATESVDRILLLQLAHFGDFIIALPAVRELRERFSDAHIRLVCGHWNVPAAEASGLFDEIRAYDYFPQQALGWSGVPVQDMTAFAAASEGRFDIAIDLRVDEDTRHLLARVDARLRCGIGSQRWYPGLDVALPTEHGKRANVADWERVKWFAAERFISRLRPVSPFLQRGRVTRAIKGNVIYGPYVTLQPGAYRAWFDLSAYPKFAWLGTLTVRLEIVRDGTVIESLVLRRQAVRQLGSVATEIAFDTGVSESTFEFRVHIAGHYAGLTLDFRGVRLLQEDRAAQVRPRFRAVEVHVGEQLSLLVALVHARASRLYRSTAPTSRSAMAAKVAGSLGVGPVFVVAPGSNSTIRNWPLKYYTELVGLLLRKADATVILVGSQSQTAENAAIVAAIDGTSRVIDLTGRTDWTDLPEVLRLADLVVCNNSGVAHQAASLGCPTLGIYSGSHQPLEWGPRGPRSRAIMAPVRCSPCGLEVLEHCEHGHICMTSLTPDIVLRHVYEMLAAYPPQTASERV